MRLTAHGTSRISIGGWNMKNLGYDSGREGSGFGRER
jgi:hypothetical protein